MDFCAETEKRKRQHYSSMGELAYERYDLVKKIESAQKRIAEIDLLIAQQEAMVIEAEQAKRNFDTYLAVKEKAVTLDQVQQAAQEGMELKVPPGAIQENKT